MNPSKALLAAAVLLPATLAAADIAPSDPVILSPFDNAQVSIIWIGSDAAYTGKLHLVDLQSAQNSILLWDNKSAIENQSYTAQRLYSQGDRVDFSYLIALDGHDSFSTFIESDWKQFEIDASNPLNVIVSIEDTRYPNGDSDYNDAVFNVVFTPATIPAPGPLALLSTGLHLVARRRRD